MTIISSSWFSTSSLVIKRESSHVDVLLLSLTFLSVLFIPSIKINDGLFLGVDELLVTLMGIRLLQQGVVWIDKFIWVIIFLSCIILVSILVNPNYKDYREYLEIHKLIKIAILYMFTCWVTCQGIAKRTIVKMVLFTFLGIVLFNVLHLFNVFYFNEFITILYDTDGRDVMNFGKNSIGGPGPKRIVGTMGNPNINAILFLFYFAFFSFLFVEDQKDHSDWKVLPKRSIQLLFLLSMLFVILCQSRTGLAALSVIYFMGIWLRSPNWKEVLMEISCVLGFFGISSYLDTVSLNYLSNTKPQLQENNSLAVRIKIWGELIGLWLKQPFFGYGPNKAFVYRTQLHPENEFVFYLWRYGIQGLLGFFAILTIPFLFLFKKIKDFSFMYFVLIIVAIVALMNNPLANPKISVLFAMILGFSVAVFFNFKPKNE